LQGTLTVSSGKRIAPQLPRVVGAWLTGTFDSDKSVSRAARDSFETSFPSEQKRDAVWRLYQGPLLAYVEAAILRHNSQTLSDERSTSPDDAEVKYVRVVSTSLLILDQLFQTDLGEKSLRDDEIFQAVINAKKIFELGSHKDASVRRAVYKLIADVIDHGVQLDWKLLSSYLLAKSLHISQVSSSAQYINALLVITKARPSVWTTEYASKTAVSHRFCQYLKQGSQRGLEAWWFHVRQLIKSIPTQAWNADGANPERQLFYDAVSQLLNALHEGVVNSDEPRQNSIAAWSAFLDIFFWFIGLLPEAEEQSRLVQSFLYPILERYLFAASDLSQWAIPPSTSLPLCSSSILKLEAWYPSTQLNVFYESKVDNLIETMRLSQPESSKNFKSSQDDIIQKARRFFDLQAAVEAKGTPKDDVGSVGPEPMGSSLSSVFASSNIHLLSEAVKLLRDRNGKPYGAAGVIHIALEKRPQTIVEVESSSSPQLLSGLLEEDAPTLIKSPSADLFVSILLKCRSLVGFRRSFTAVLQESLRDDALRRSHAYTNLLRGIMIDDLLQHPDLEQQLLQDLSAALDGDDSRWPIVYEILANPNLKQSQDFSEISVNDSIQGRIVHDMLSGLATDEREDNALKGFEFTLNRDPSLRSLPLSHLNLASLLTRLLLLSDSHDEDRGGRAARLASLVKTILSKKGGTGTGTSSVEIVGRQLEGEEDALSILSLVAIAREALQDADKENKSSLHSAIFPTAHQWQKALTPFLQIQPPLSISLITPLQGCGFLVNRERRRSSGGLPRDSEGFSAALRFAILVTNLLDSVSLQQLTIEQREAVYLYYPQALQLANDKLSIESANALWIDSTEDVVQEVTDMVAKGQKSIQSWVHDKRSENDDDVGSSLVSYWLSELPNIQGTSAQAFNLGRTFTTIMTEASDANGTSKYMPLWDSTMRAVRSSSDVVKSAAVLAVCRETLATSALGKRLCNELVADATDIDFNDENGGKWPGPAKDVQILMVHSAIQRLVLLNLLIKREDDLVDNVPSQRLIFLAKHLISIPSFDQAPDGLQSELLSTLASILPSIKDLYGEFWHGAVSLLTQYLGSVSDAGQLAPLHSALRLHACLVSLTKGESNEDLEEELSKAKPSLETSLLEILTHFDGKSCYTSLLTELKCPRNPIWSQSASRNHHCPASSSGAESSIRQTRRYNRALSSLIVGRSCRSRSSLWYFASITPSHPRASVNRDSPL
jgi:E3 ubiquitin-protein ligase listerin